METGEISEVGKLVSINKMSQIEKKLAETEERERRAEEKKTEKERKAKEKAEKKKTKAEEREKAKLVRERISEAKMAHVKEYIDNHNFQSTNKAEQSNLPVSQQQSIDGIFGKNV